MGFAGADDAGIVALNADNALIHTVDFFTPIVDDPYKFGAIAAANALSDVYAMGGEPLAAMNIVCFPTELPEQVLADILRGGADVLDEAGALLVGGHSVRDKELKFGLAVTGLVHPDKYWENAGARPGDALVLTKPLGTGVFTTAFKRDAIDESELAPIVESMRMLNRLAKRAAEGVIVHAATDITGNGLAGHAFEMAAASDVTIVLRAGSLPVFPGTLDLIRRGFVPGGAKSNRRYVAGAAKFNVDETMEQLTLDPQTSGGLLLAVPDPEAVQERLTALGQMGVVVGSVEAGSKMIVVEP